MTFTLSEQRSWYDTYTSENELAQVLAAIGRRLPPNGAVDWAALLAITVAEPASCQFSPIEEGHAFTSALEWLCGGSLGTAPRLDFTPVLLDTPSIDLLEGRLRLHSIPYLLDRWQTLGTAAQTHEEQSARTYTMTYLRPGVALSDAAKESDFGALVGPYCRVTIVRIMRAAASHRTPVRLLW